MLLNPINNEIKLAILLRDFCNNCPHRGSCNNKEKCKAIEFAEYLIDAGFVDGKFLL